MVSQSHPPDSPSVITSHFNYESNPEDLTLKLAEGISTILDTDIEAVQPIGKTVDLDALNRMFAMAETTSPSPQLSTSFVHQSVHIEIKDTGELTFTPPH